MIFDFKNKTKDQIAEKLFRDGHVYRAERPGICLISGEPYFSNQAVYKLSPGSRFAGIVHKVTHLAQKNRGIARMRNESMKQFTVPLDERLMDPAPEVEESTNVYSAHDFLPAVEDLAQPKTLNISDNNVLAELQGIRGQFSQLNETISSLIGIIREMTTPAPKLSNEVQHILKPETRGGRGREFQPHKKAEPKCQPKARKSSAKFMNSLSPLERTILDGLVTCKLEGSPTQVLDQLKARRPGANLPVNAREFSKAINKLDLKKLGVKVTKRNGSPRFLRLEKVR